MGLSGKTFYFKCSFGCWDRSRCLYTLLVIQCYKNWRNRCTVGKATLALVKCCVGLPSWRPTVYILPWRRYRVYLIPRTVKLFHGLFPLGFVFFYGLFPEKSVMFCRCMAVLRPHNSKGLRRTKRRSWEERRVKRKRRDELRIEKATMNSGRTKIRSLERSNVSWKYWNR